jgi:chromosome segregation ATPase
MSKLCPDCNGGGCSRCNYSGVVDWLSELLYESGGSITLTVDQTKRITDLETQNEKLRAEMTKAKRRLSFLKECNYRLAYRIQRLIETVVALHSKLARVTAHRDRLMELVDPEA